MMDTVIEMFGLNFYNAYIEMAHAQEGEELIRMLDFQDEVLRVLKGDSCFLTK